MKKGYIQLLILFLIVHPTFPVKIGKVQKGDKIDCSSDADCKEGQFCAGIEFNESGKCRLKSTESTLDKEYEGSDACSSPFSDQCKDSENKGCSRCYKKNLVHTCQNCMPNGNKCFEDPWGSPERPNHCCSGICFEGFCAEQSECGSCTDQPGCCKAGTICPFTSTVGQQCQNSCASLGEKCDGITGPFCCDGVATCSPNMVDGTIDGHVCSLTGEKKKDTAKEDHNKGSGDQKNPDSCHNEGINCRKDKECCNGLSCKQFSKSIDSIEGLCLKNDFCYGERDYGCCQDSDCCDKTHICQNQKCVPEFNCFNEGGLCEDDVNCCEGLKCFKNLKLFKNAIDYRGAECQHCGKENDLCENHKNCCSGLKCYYDTTGAFDSSYKFLYKKSCQPEQKTQCISPGLYCDVKSFDINIDDYGNIRKCCAYEEALKKCKDDAFKAAIEHSAFNSQCEKILKIEDNIKERGRHAITCKGINTQDRQKRSFCSLQPTCSNLEDKCWEGFNCCDETHECVKRDKYDDPRCYKKIEPCDPLNNECPKNTICEEGKCKECVASHEDCTKNKKCCEVGELCFNAPPSSHIRNPICQPKRCIEIGEIVPIDLEFTYEDCCDYKSEDTEFSFDLTDGKCHKCFKSGTKCEVDEDCCQYKDNNLFCRIHKSGLYKTCTPNKEECVVKQGICKKDKDCCEKLSCLYPRENNGEPKKCLHKNGHCISSGNCDFEFNPCCKGLYCDNGSCHSCKNEGGYCQVKENCCNNLECYQNKCIPEGKCIKEGACTKEDNRCCGVCFEGKCQDCVLPGRDCSSNSNCCKGQCVFIRDGKTKICSEKVDYCIDEYKPCNAAIEAGQKCCKGHCIDDKCTVCQPENEECKIDGDCCNEFKCVFYIESKGVFKGKCQKIPECAKDHNACNYPDKLKGVECCSGKKCIDYTCIDCVQMNEDCTNKECCQGNCYFTGNDKESRICMQKPLDCVEKEKFCGIGGDKDFPPCCENNKCVDGRCKKCSNPTNKHKCNNDEDCCNTNEKCLFDMDGAERYCRPPNETECVKRICDKDLNAPFIPGFPRKCCSPLKCMEGFCIECKEHKESCDPEGERCCGNSICWNIAGKNENPNYKCLNPSDCVNEHLLEGVKCNEFYKCCEGFNCINGMCNKCPLGNDECTTDCCEGFTCCFDPKTNKKKLCVSNDEAPKIKNCHCVEDQCTESRHCCKGHCYKEDKNAEFGSCRNDCVANGDDCSDNKKCCSGFCAKTKDQKRICGNISQCQDFGWPCEFVYVENGFNLDVKEVVARNQEVVATNQELFPSCCNDLTCYNGICRNKCINLGESCSKNRNACCSGPNKCYWDSDGLQLICHEYDNICIKIGGNCINPPDETENLKKCCPHLDCNDEGKCAKCIQENKECDPNVQTDDTKCCRGKCSQDSDGKHRCLLNPADCIQKDGDCTNGDLDCCEENGLKLNCDGGKCSNCIPLYKSEQVNRPCDKDSDCCKGSKCYFSGFDNNRYCFEKEQCRDPTKSCGKVIVGSIYFELTCCNDFTCHNGHCMDKICYPNGKLCKEHNDCCSNKCVQNFKGERVCGYENQCIQVSYTCNKILVSDGVTTLPGCCNPNLDFPDQHIECSDGECKPCVPINGRNIDGKKCCEGTIWGWNKSGKDPSCIDPKDNCVVPAGFCGRPDPDSFVLNDKRVDFPPRVCCEENTCYKGRCQKRKCKHDREECKTKEDCCSKNCFYDDKFIHRCMDRDYTCLPMGNICGLKGDDGKIIEYAEACCSPYTCGHDNTDAKVMRCKDCKSQGNPCTYHKECCSSICGWDEIGENLICYQPDNPNQHCVKTGNNCSNEKFASIPKNCCPGHMCYHGKCRKCSKKFGEICYSDEECCTKKCVFDKDGLKKCLDEEKCIDQDGLGPCLTLLEYNAGELEGFQCCEQSNFFCIGGKCKRCTPKRKSCSNNEECCTGVCAWSPLLHDFTCHGKDYCVEEDGYCGAIHPSLVSRVHPRKCCVGKYCYQNKCVPLCAEDGQICLTDESCCSKICSPNEKGIRVCGRTNKVCQLENEVCGFDIKTVLSGETEENSITYDLFCCSPELQCKNNVCVKSGGRHKCKKEGENCEIGSCCEDLFCSYDEYGEVKTCKKTPTDCSNKICFPGIFGCCKGKVCVNNKCKDCINSDNSGGICCSDEECCGELVCRDGSCVDKCVKSGKVCVADADCCAGLVCSKSIKKCIKIDCESLDKELLDKLLNSGGTTGTMNNKLFSMMKNQRFKKLRATDSDSENSFNITENSMTDCITSSDCHISATCVKLRHRKVCMEDSTLQYLKSLETKLALKRLYKTNV